MARYTANTFAEASGIINKIVGKKNRKYLKYTWENLVQKTPVDTYTASNSWFVSSRIPSSVRPGYRVYGKRPVTPSYLESDLAFKFKFRNSKYWFITNNQPYIFYLENGHSSQAPRGFIRTTVRQMTTLANSGAF